jgi:uncharacterized protein (DUF362 family)
MSEHNSAKSIPVGLFRILEYESTLLDRATAMVLEETGFKINPGTKVLIKPNMVTARRPLACTHPNVILSVCRYLLDCGARVTVGDSPSYGSAAQVAKSIGLASGLARLGVKIKTLGRPVPLKLSFGEEIGISRDALETDFIVNIPKLKAHCQFNMTGAIKNMFGCVVGFRKAMAHARFGENPGLMEQMIVEVADSMPLGFNVMDGIYAMHKTGPIKGESFELSLLAASPDAWAIDTACYMLLGLNPGQLLLWNEGLRRNISGCNPDNLYYPVEPPDNFDTKDFQIPVNLSPMEFEFFRVVKGQFKNLLKLFKR